MMNHEMLIKRIENKGIKVNVRKDGIRNDYYTARNGDKFVSWFTQPRFGKEGHKAVAVHAPSSQTDIMTDCNCDIYFRTIKSVVEFLTKN